MESCPTPSTVPDSDPAQTAVVGLGLELKLEDEATGVHQKSESVAADCPIPPNTVPTLPKRAILDQAESAKVRPPDGSAAPSEPQDLDPKQPLQQVTPTQDGITKLGDDQIPCQERSHAGPQLATASTSTSAPLVQQPPVPQLRREDSEPVVAAPPATSHRETPHTRMTDAAVVKGGEQEIRADEGLGAESPVTGGRRTARVAPEKRGGRGRGSPTSDQADPSKVVKRTGQTRTERLELVCWLQGMSWVVGVEVPEDFQLRSPQVRQPPDVVLEEEGSRGRCWRLKQPLDSVFVAPAPDETRAMPPEILAAPYRIFKLIGAHGTRGRAVRQGSVGRFLVVVPESWRWNEELSGAPADTAEHVSSGACRAHHVELPLEAGRTLVFNTWDGDRVRIPCAGQRFDLEGARVDDAREDVGPLFAGDPPQLRWSSGAASETAIARVVAGEEGFTEGKRRWRAHGERFEDLRPAIARRRAGWFFVRLYDSGDELVESLDFRFVAGLEAIEVEAASAVPGPEGHPPALIHVRHQQQCSVRSQAIDSPTVRSLPRGCHMVVPADPRHDETRWLVGPIDGPHVEVTVLVERVWWAHVREGAETSESQWNDRPLSLSRDDFKATSVAAITLRLPRPGWAVEGVVGLLLAEVSPPLEAEGFLRSLGQLKPSSLMSVLTRVRPPCCVPLRRIIRDLRMESYERIPKHKRGTTCEPFVKEGLCVLALALERLEVLKTPGMILPERWARRARKAQVHFPGAMSAVRSRYRDIEEEFATEHRSRTRRRTDRC